MFYCNECARKRGYPITAFKSKGYCEVTDCHAFGSMNEMPSSMLPMQNQEPFRRGGNLNRGRCFTRKSIETY